MADMTLGSAQGAVDSLLGSLTSILVNEAQLLGGVRRDVQFIKDEMESMNGFLLHVAEAVEEDHHQVGAWMKQVAEVAYASQNSVDRYIRSIGAGRREPGLLGYLRRLPKLVWTLPTRHRIANQIRELKVRSCEVGERRMRYDVKVPNRDHAIVKKAGWQAAGNDKQKHASTEERRRDWVNLGCGYRVDINIEARVDRAIRGIWWDTELQPILEEIVSKPLPVGLFERALYANPNRTAADLQRLCDNLDNSTTLSSYNARQVLKFYDLTSNCMNCLLYMYIFPEYIISERARLVRRWAAEGMTAKRGRLSALDEADHCFDLLVAHGFLITKEISSKLKVKSYRRDNTFLDIFTQIAREDHFVKNNNHLYLAYSGHIESHRDCYPIHEELKSLPSPSQLGLLKVLDLESCYFVCDDRVKIICNHAFHLKYLSLRKTFITELPKQLDKLQSLETLDIRETNVTAFAKNSVFLPKLKHLLAGRRTGEILDSNGNVYSKEKFSTVAMPKHIGEMTELQVMSHIAVSGNGSELKYVGYLLQLVKLGVIVSGSKASSVLRHLYHATGNLGFLSSLSIRVTETDEEDENVNKQYASPIYPKYLHKLKISGLKNGLPSWIQKLKVLTKITLHMTFITDEDIEILGQITSLSWLRLQQESCNESTLTFKKDAFQSLALLKIKCSAITSINFNNEACPKLKKLAWYSTGEQSVSGIEGLLGLQELKLTGKFDRETVEQALAANQNKPTLSRW